MTYRRASRFRIGSFLPDLYTAFARFSTPSLTPPSELPGILDRLHKTPQHLKAYFLIEFLVYVDKHAPCDNIDS